MPLRTRILTSRGWLTPDQVRVGDEAIGYNCETGRSEWTRVERVVHYRQAETVRFGNAYWSVECTPEHRWLMEHVSYESPVGVTSGRRGYVPGRKEVIRGEALTELRCRRAKHRVILARPADLGGSLPITMNEAALLGWVAGDGTVAEAKDYWRPRKPEQPATPDAPYGYRRDGQPKKNRSGRPRRTDLQHKVSSFYIKIVQSKPEHFAAIERASADAPYVGRGISVSAHGKRRECRSWQLGADYSKDLLERAGHPKRDSVQQVLAMSPAQREAWLEAIIASEGTCEGTKTTIYQDDGPIADAIELAIYLSGKRPSRTRDSRGEGNWAIRITAPTIGGPQRSSFMTEAGHQNVWSAITDLGSWTAEQDGQVFLTGNSLRHH
jgi:hypothetical protein